MNAARSAVLVAIAAVFVAGCSKDVPKPKTDKETPTAIPGEQGASKVTSGEVAIRRPKLPDDVFFDDPLAVANNRTRIDGREPEGEPVVADTTEGTPQAEPESAPAEGGAARPVDWAALLPAELLVAEVDRIRERFEPKLASVANFNNSVLDIPPYAAELAALGGIATAHPGDVPWKRNAKYVRDLAAAMTAEELQRGQKSFEQAKEPFDKIVTILDGKTPEGLPESADETDFSVADFGYLMKRFEAGQNATQTIAGSQSSFKQNAADLAREMHVFAALSKVVASDDHGYGDDAKFQEFASGMTQAATDAAAAAEAGDFEKFGTSFNALGQSCVRCHGEYRNN